MQSSILLPEGKALWSECERVNEILTAMADAIVGVGPFSPDWVEQVTTTVGSILRAVFIAVVLGAFVAETVLSIHMWLKSPGEGWGWFALVGVALTTMAILIVLIGVVYRSEYLIWEKGIEPVMPHAMRRVSGSPWFYIIFGVTSIVIYHLIWRHRDPSNVPAGFRTGLVKAVRTILILFFVALTTLGVLGLFDYRFVHIARTSLQTFTKLEEVYKNAYLTFGFLIGDSLFFIASIVLTVQELKKPAAERSRVRLWGITTIIAGALVVLQLILTWSYYT